MSDWIVAVPTYRRAALLPQRTLAVLAAAGVPPNRIHVYLSDPAERNAYAAALPPDYRPQLHDGAPGLAGNRNLVMAAWPAGQRIIFCDDDLQGLSQRVSAKHLSPVTDLPGLADEAFTWAEKAGAWLWGVYPVHNPYFMKPRLRTDLRFIYGCFYGVTVRHDPCEQASGDDKDDYERTLQFYARDGALLRLEWVAPKQRFMVEPGGMQQLGRAQRDEDAARALAARFPGLATFYRHRSGRAELRLRDQRKAPAHA